LENFCTQWCGDNAVCVQGQCLCEIGFERVGDFCVTPGPHHLEKEVKDYKATADAFITLWVFTMLAAIGGWVMWWRGRGGHGSYQQIHDRL
jgi:hypothetical protein